MFKNYYARRLVYDDGIVAEFCIPHPANKWRLVLAIVTSTGIAGLTVGYKAIKAALVNPVRSLRSE